MRTAVPVDDSTDDNDLEPDTVPNPFGVAPSHHDRPAPLTAAAVAAELAEELGGFVPIHRNGGLVAFEKACPEHAPALVSIRPWSTGSPRISCAADVNCPYGARAGLLASGHAPIEVTGPDGQTRRVERVVPAPPLGDNRAPAEMTPVDEDTALYATLTGGPWGLLKYIKDKDAARRADHYDTIVVAIAREEQPAARRMLCKEAASVFRGTTSGQVLHDVMQYRATVASLPPAPWETEVDGAAWLDTFAELLRRFVVLPAHGDTALTLWALWTYVFDAFDVAPILTITSPTMRCGKTTLTGLLAAVVRQPLMTSNVSEAVIYRVIEKRHPTLLIDEFDSFFELREGMRNLLNSGHHRDGAKVERCVGDDHEPRTFSTWAPKVLSLIGLLPSTLDDRSIVVPMRRKTPSEHVGRLNRKVRRQLRLDITEPLRRQALRWTQDHLEDFVMFDTVALPNGLDDRAEDNWEPLLAIADVVGGNWPDRAREAALALSGAGSHRPDTSLGIRLLSTIRSLLTENLLGGRSSTITTSTLVGWLSSIETFKSRTGKAIDSIRLSDLLRPFEIAPGTVRQGEQTSKGYYLAAFEEAFGRYLPPPDAPEPGAGGPISGSNPSHPSHPNRHAPKRTVTDPSQSESVTGPQTAESSHKHRGVTGVTGSSLEIGPQRPSTKHPVPSTRQPVVNSTRVPVR